MKVIHTPSIVDLFRLLLLFWAVMPAKGQDSAFKGFVGEWCNKDSATRGNTRIHVRSEGSKLVVHRWGRCHPTECDGGETTAARGLAKSISLTWEDGFATTTQQLTLVADGVLELSGHTHFLDQSRRVDYDSKEIFVKGLVHDWSDNATGTPSDVPPPPQKPVPPPQRPAPPPQKPAPPPPKPKPVQKILDWSNASEYPNVTFRFRTTVATAPVVYLSERAIDGKRIDPKTIAASKTGPVGTVHNIQINLPRANKDKKYHFVVIIDGQPMWTDTIEVSIPRQY